MIGRGKRRWEGGELGCWVLEEGGEIMREEKGGRGGGYCRVLEEVGEIRRERRRGGGDGRVRMLGPRLNRGGKEGETGEISIVGPIGKWGGNE